MKTGSIKRILNPMQFILILIVPLYTLAEPGKSRWRWSNPSPHGNNILDMYADADSAIQVGDSGAIFVDQSGRWAPVDSGTDVYLRSTTRMGLRYIVTGENGTILWSDNGRTFQPAILTPPTTDWLEGVTATPQKAVAVGDQGSIYSSSDGINWAKSPATGSSEWLRGVAFGNGAFVAVGENGTILRSSGGSSWLPVTSGTLEHLNRVRYLGSASSGNFYAVGNHGTVLTSSSGNAPWTLTNVGTTNDLNDAAFSSSGLVLAGDGELILKKTGSSEWINQVTALSSNAPPDWMYISAGSRMNSWLVAGRTGLLMEGSTVGSKLLWQPSPAYSSHAWLWDLTMQDGIYIAVGDLAHIQSSLDGILWTREVVPESHTNVIWLGVGGTSNLVLAVGNDGAVLASTSDPTEVTATNMIDGTSVTTNIFVNALGVSWDTVPSYTDQTLQGVDASDELYITTGAGGTIFTSPNGTNNWITQSTPTTDFLSSVAIGPNRCVAVGANGTLLQGTEAGSSWAAIPTGTSDWIYRIRWTGGTFIAVGENGRIMTSPDGAQWTTRTSGTDRWLTDITFVDGQWYVTGYQGTLLSSPDLISWMRHSIPTGKSLYGAATKNGQLIMAGVEGIILRNQIIPHTDPVQILDYRQGTTLSAGVTNTFELFLFGGIPDQIFEFQYSTNLLSNWETEQNIELYDPSGTLYLIQTRPETNMPPSEFSRAGLIP